MLLQCFNRSHVAGEAHVYNVFTFLTGRSNYPVALRYSNTKKCPCGMANGIAQKPIIVARNPVRSINNHGSSYARSDSKECKYDTSASKFR